MMARTKQILHGTPVPIGMVEEQMKLKLSDACSQESNVPNTEDFEWILDNELTRLTCPFSDFPQRRSKAADEWKQELQQSAYSMGYSQSSPHIQWISESSTKARRNLNDHIALNGVKQCRDIDIVIDDESECKVHKQMDIMQIVKVTNHSRVPALIGHW